MARARKPAPWRANVQRRPDRKTSRSILLRGLAATAVLIALVAPGANLPLLHFVVQKLEYVGYDVLLSTLPERQRAEGVVIVDVDEASLRELGQWPWPRDRVARLIESIHHAGAAAIGIDFIFAEPDERSLARMAERIAEQARIDVRAQLAETSNIEIDNDAVLARTLSRPNVVSAVWLDRRPVETGVPIELPVPQTIVRATAGAQEEPIPRANRGTLPVPILFDAVHRFGFVNALPDEDGTIRRLPLLYAYGLQYVPALSLATVMAARGLDTIEMRVTGSGVQSVTAGGMRIPTDHQGNMLIPFRQPYAAQFVTVSAVDVLKGHVDLTVFEDAVVLVGTTVTALKDTSPVPHDRNLAGIRIHAMAAAAMLAEDFIQSPPYEFIAMLLSILSAGLIATLLIANRSLGACIAVIGGLVFTIAVGTQWLFVHQLVYISPTPAILTLIIVSLLLGITRIRGEERRALRSIQELAVAQDCAILGLVSVAETRDPETGRHILRTQHYVRALAERMSTFPGYAALLDAVTIDTLFRSAPLHDIGKVGVPDSVLLKPGKLTEEEFNIMKLHTVHGHEVLTHAERMAGLDADTSFLRCAAEIAKCHHERWDGSGYPDGLARHEIPLSARMMALADVYDALRSKRHYKESFSHEKSRAIIIEAAGMHFDPDVVRAFTEIEAEFVRIASRFSDDDGPISSLHDYPEHDAHPVH